MAGLSDDAEKWLREFVADAISSGLQDHSAFISEDVCGELMEKGWIDRTSGNDGDYPWHGKVELDENFREQLREGLERASQVIMFRNWKFGLGRGLSN